LQASLAMWKADIDSAFRRIPIKKSHRDLAWTAWRTGNKVGMAKHYCMPFGAIASVHYWDRIGMTLLPSSLLLCAFYLCLQVRFSQPSRERSYTFRSCGMWTISSP
jgi:hypothetical protein